MMEKIIISLGIIAIIASGCGQRSNRQTAAETNGADSLINNDEQCNDEHLRQKIQEEQNAFFEEEASKWDKYHVEDTDTSSFVRKNEWSEVECMEYQTDNGYTIMQKCFFQNANLEQVYNIVKKIDTNLKTQLPANNIRYTTEQCNVTYRYETEKHLFIELSYDGGVTYVEIMKNENNTQSKITYSRD